jgi:hypothetical protein
MNGGELSAPHVDTRYSHQINIYWKIIRTTDRFHFELLLYQALNPPSTTRQ